jgi:A/G-specific adenine glycosylase
MLQQTQVARVLAPYGQFVARFATPGECAKASVADVVRSWRGLGYNGRAVRLHACARELVIRHGGEVPNDLDALVALPGVGAYTARAVLAFAFERPFGVVDTNAARVLARAVAGAPLRSRAAQELADALVPSQQAWGYNQALLDLGALHCRAREPRCDGCPIRAYCRWCIAGRQGPDPAVTTAGTTRPQARFAGSDRQGRGRIVDAARRAPVSVGELGALTGWEDEARRLRVVAQLEVDGLLVHAGDGVWQLADAAAVTPGAQAPAAPSGG